MGTEADQGLTMEWNSSQGRSNAGTLTVSFGDELYTDNFDITKAAKRTAFVEAVCERFSALKANDQSNELHRKLDEIAANEARARTAPRDPASPTLPDADALLDDMPEDIRDEALAMLQDPRLIEIILHDIAAIGVAGETNLAATIYLIGISRLLSRPLAAILQGPSSGGKSYVLNCVAELFPDECLIRATEMSPQALYYMEPGSLVHRFIVAGERSRRTDADAEEATKAIRQMISEGCINKYVTIEIGGKRETVKLQQDGPIAYIETTTLQNIFVEDRNRCLLLPTDEREAQTKRIIRRIGDDASGFTPDSDATRIILKHHAAQRIIKCVPVCVPYARAIGDNFPTERVEARRVISHLLSMIGASTLLHHRQRLTNDKGQLVAQQEDYEIAKRLLDESTARLLGRSVSAAAKRFYERLKDYGIGETFNIRDIMEHERLSDTAIRGYVSELSSTGYLKICQEHRYDRAQHKPPAPGHWRPTP